MSDLLKSFQESVQMRTKHVEPLPRQLSLREICSPQATTMSKLREDGFGTRLKGLNLPQGVIILIWSYVRSLWTLCKESLETYLGLDFGPN
ncbi:hypothetical protein MtrunA17_Chr8g0335641 [Medicago truncatula]|nr:hypothetical protein MtrunA17_Chr8g0335641 [Medicago truncatula]